MFYSNNIHSFVSARPARLEVTIIFFPYLYIIHKDSTEDLWFTHLSIVTGQKDDGVVIFSGRYILYREKTFQREVVHVMINVMMIWSVYRSIRSQFQEKIAAQTKVIVNTKLYVHSAYCASDTVIGFWNINIDLWRPDTSACRKGVIFSPLG